MIKLIHMATAFISIFLFILRGYWVFKQSPMMNKKWVKIVPHVNDTILLIAAIFLVFAIQQYPFVDSWLTAKLIALFVYIIFGMFALKRAKKNQYKIMFFVLSLLTFGYIVGVALTRSASWLFN